MRTEDYTRDVLLDVIGSYLKQIECNKKDFPGAVLSDLEASMRYVLKTNQYNGRYSDTLYK